MDNVTDETHEILKKVRQIEIRTRRMVTDSMSGAYHSAFKGQGMDFEEVREYAPGDDIRSIDWNVSARMDNPFIKVFREERELTIMLIVDISASGIFGSEEKSKREITAEIASVLAFSATKNNDKVGLLLYSDQVEKFVYPKKGSQHILRLVRDILFFKPESKGTDLTKALNHMNKLLKRKSIVFLISDFLSTDDSSSNATATLKALNLTNKRHDLSCIALSDAHEHSLPNVGIVTLEDAETGESVEIDTSSAKMRKLYKISNLKRVGTLKQDLQKRGIDFLEISTNKPYIVPLRNYFARRARKL